MRLVATALLVLFTVPASADYKIVTRTSRADRKGQNTFVTVRLVQGERQREQIADGRVAIFQCDLHQLVYLNPGTRLYRVVKLNADGFPRQNSTFARSRAKTVSVELPDRATIFGRPAWHVQDVVEEQRTRTDIWYIDVPIREGCLASAQTVRGNNVRRGLAVLTRYVYQVKPGAQNEFVAQVTEFQETSLDPVLFEIPPDYREALDTAMTVPSTPANRAKRAWNDMWTALAHFIYE